MKWLAATLLLALMPHLAYAQRFYIEVDKKESVLGQMVTLSVRAEDLAAPLAQLQYDALKRDFEIVNTSLSSQTITRNRREIKIEVMELALYPLHIGRITVPTLEFAGKKSQPLSLNILESSPAVPRVLFETGILPAQAMQRQEIYLYLDVYHDGSLQWRKPPQIKAAGSSVRALPDAQRLETLEGVRYVVQRFAWGVMPLRGSDLRIVFPNLEANKFGERLRYPVTPQFVPVQSLPAYLPVEMHVGKLQIDAQPLPQKILLGRPFNWTLRVTASGISRDGIAKSLSGLASNKDLDFYPTEFNLSNSVNPSNPLQQTLEMVVPMQARKAGEYTLPAVRIPYYDPISGRIESAAFPNPIIHVVNPFWRSLKIAVLMLISALVVLWLAQHSTLRWKRQQRRRQWLASLAAAQDAAQLRSALLMSRSDRTLGLWLRNWETRQGKNGKLRNAIQQLEQAGFSRGKNDITFVDLRQELIALLRFS